MKRKRVNVTPRGHQVTGSNPRTSERRTALAVTLLHGGRRYYARPAPLRFTYRPGGLLPPVAGRP